ncbi:MAG: tRNA uridine-5-carboxymethylaminomethyl(34) synthesis GTPase MnmE [Candidatus Gastranaerophilales bacterium]|nr:tRNA uridine-5-carboxymethylaminomethyl(34) synthesis GTPase MnmE [Candidatus Gastranaerophilales bacterium]
MENNFDTIVAIITPLAQGAVGIIRISGDEAFDIARSIFTKEIKPKMINYGHIKDDNNNILDEVILLPFVSPHSYTGEDVIEIQTHGSPSILNSILELILSKGARLAQRGEFTKRAFLNHRIDLSQAEAVLDVIKSKSEKSAQNALSNLGGYLKIKINQLKQDLIETYSKVIASIDFPEDVAEVDKNSVVSICSDKIIQIDDILKNSKSHDFIRDGISACLIGKPNVGKSSLFNSLLNYSRAIVTDIAGTTRDTIKESINLNGYIINFIDTAGVRDKKDADIVEQIGIDNSLEAIKESEIVLFLYESSIDEIDADLIKLSQDKQVLYVKTKADLSAGNDENILEISSKTGFGIDKLKDEIISIIKNLIPQDTNYTTNKRQQTCLIRAKEALNNVIQTASLDDLADLYAIDLKQSILALDEITGEVLTDTILENIFDAFCIGK